MSYLFEHSNAIQISGVGAGGIVSSAFCLLYKLSSLKLTSKQVYGLMNHADSPYIRGLGFMYVRWVFNITTYTVLHCKLRKNLTIKTTYCKNKIYFYGI